jgi:hypothetical protein
MFSNFILQTYDDLTTNLFLSSLENGIIFIIMSIAIFIIISTPVVLFYFSIDYFFKIRKTKKIIDTNICCLDSKTHASFDKKICSDFLNNYSFFVGNFAGLIIWNIVSLVYIFTQFSDFLSGFTSYLKFPFEILNNYEFNNVLASIAQYKSSFIFMGMIFITTLIVYFVVIYVTPFFIRNSVKNNINKYKIA